MRHLQRGARSCQSVAVQARVSFALFESVAAALSTAGAGAVSALQGLVVGEGCGTTGVGLCMCWVEGVLNRRTYFNPPQLPRPSLWSVFQRERQQRMVEPPVPQPEPSEQWFSCVVGHSDEEEMDDACSYHSAVSSVRTGSRNEVTSSRRRY